MSPDATNSSMSGKPFGLEVFVEREIVPGLETLGLDNFELARHATLETTTLCALY